MADVEKLKFTCCGCFKTFVAKSGQGMRIINCPYCGQKNAINTGKPKPKPKPPVVDLSFPIEQVFFNSNVYRDPNGIYLDFPKQCERALNSTLDAGDDVIVHLDDISVPAKITSLNVGQKLFTGNGYFDFAFRSITGKDFSVKSKYERVPGDLYHYAYTHVVFQYATADKQDEIYEFSLTKYHPEYYPEVCRKAIQKQNEKGFTFP